MVTAGKRLHAAGARGGWDSGGAREWRGENLVTATCPFDCPFRRHHVESHQAHGQGQGGVVLVPAFCCSTRLLLCAHGPARATPRPLASRTLCRRGTYAHIFRHALMGTVVGAKQSPTRAHTILTRTYTQASASTTVTGRVLERRPHVQPFATNGRSTAMVSPPRVCHFLHYLGRRSAWQRPPRSSRSCKARQASSQRSERRRRSNYHCSNGSVSTTRIGVG